MASLRSMAFSGDTSDHPKGDPALMVFAVAVLSVMALLAFAFGWH